MRTLWLLRHAKAGAGRADEGDHDRTLEERGLAAAERMGRHLGAAGFAPALVLCSTAVRARQTLDRLVHGLGAALDTEFDRDLYLASAGELATRVRAVPDDVSSLLVVAHNPGIAELAIQLAQRGEPVLRTALRTKYPTCALAELRFESPRWRDLSGDAELVSYLVPQDLRSRGTE